MTMTMTMAMTATGATEEFTARVGALAVS